MALPSAPDSPPTLPSTTPWSAIAFHVVAGRPLILAVGDACQRWPRVGPRLPAAALLAFSSVLFVTGNRFT